MADLSKLIFLSSIPSFMAENNVISGSVNITGTTDGGMNIREWTIPIGVDADYYDVQFNGRTGNDPIFGAYAREEIRNTGWFRSGYAVTSPSSGGGLGSNYPLPWTVTGRIKGRNLIIRAEYGQQFVATMTVSSTPIYYRIVPYSATV